MAGGGRGGGGVSRGVGAETHDLPSPLQPVPQPWNLAHQNKVDARVKWKAAFDGFPFGETEAGQSKRADQSGSGRYRVS